MYIHLCLLVKSCAASTTFFLCDELIKPYLTLKNKQGLFFQIYLSPIETGVLGAGMVTNQAGLIQKPDKFKAKGM